MQTVMDSVLADPRHRDIDIIIDGRRRSGVSTAGMAYTGPPVFREKPDRSGVEREGSGFRLPLAQAAKNLIYLMSEFARQWEQRS